MIEWMKFRIRQLLLRTGILSLVSAILFSFLFFMDYKKIYFLALFTPTRQVPLYLSFLYYVLLFVLPVVSLIIAHDNHKLINRYYLSALARKDFVLGVYGSNAFNLVIYTLMLSLLPLVYHATVLDSAVAAALFFLVFYGIFLVSFITLISFVFGKHALLVSILAFGLMIIMPSPLSYVTFDIGMHLFWGGFLFLLFSLFSLSLAWLYIGVKDL
ncbi:MAG: hypothetical protein ACQESG_01470 [Nanobdellota archaeon]